MPDADLILAGYGVRDTLQLTVEAQRALTRVGKVYTIGLPANLGRYLKSLRVAAVDLSGRFAEGRDFADAYLDVAGFVLRRLSEERPVVVMTQGNPLFLNSVTRFLVQEARKRGLNVEVLPAVSELDALIAYLGLDVGANGLQIFQAARMLERRQEISVHVPLVLCQLEGIGVSRVEQTNGARDLAGLAGYLQGYYPGEHRATLITLQGPAPAHRTVKMEQIAELSDSLRAGSFLFVDVLRRREEPQEGTVS
jgi:precorrin-2 methylase